MRALTALGAVMLVVAVPLSAQASHWASPSDSTASYLIGLERAWGEEACTGRIVSDSILADDFYGQSHSGRQFDKAIQLAELKSDTTRARECRMLEVPKVHRFGANLAILYGKQLIGRTGRRCLAWSDTWLRRNGRWAMISSLDTFIDCPATA